MGFQYFFFYWGGSIKEDSVNTLELHYYLKDGSHFMDAFVRHKCEAEILAIAKEVADTFNINIDIESEAFRKGGLKELWKFLGRNGTQLTLILTVITTILSRVPVSNGEMDELQKEYLKLAIEEKKNQIEQLKKELNNNELKANDTTTKRLAAVFSDNHKVTKRLSNFYQSLNSYEKVTEISTTLLNDRKQQFNDPIFVKRKQFSKFILVTDDLPEITDDDSVIGIVSPVLSQGNYKWKGIYDGKIIDFSMKDEKYKEAVTKKEITFQNGYAIKCVLVITRKIDDLGNVQNTGYSVSVVLEETEGQFFIETEQGKRYKKHKKDLESQLSLGFESQ